MKRRPALLALAAAFAIFLLATPAMGFQEPDRPKTDWEKVEEAMRQGLPKTAIEHLQPIIDRALQEKDYPEAIKAIATKIALEGNIEGLAREMAGKIE